MWRHRRGLCQACRGVGKSFLVLSVKAVTPFFVAPSSSSQNSEEEAGQLEIEALSLPRPVEAGLKTLGQCTGTARSNLRRSTAQGNCVLMHHVCSCFSVCWSYSERLGLLFCFCFLFFVFSVLGDQVQGLTNVRHML